MKIIIREYGDNMGTTIIITGYNDNNNKEIH